TLPHMPGTYLLLVILENLQKATLCLIYHVIIAALTTIGRTTHLISGNALMTLTQLNGMNWKLG
ncbi:Hypothetical predicted protein, partial [Pelobates cultripes]